MIEYIYPQLGHTMSSIGIYNFTSRIIRGFYLNSERLCRQPLACNSHPVCRAYLMYMPHQHR